MHAKTWMTLGLATLVAGCTFGAVTGFAQLADEVAVGVLSVDEEGDRVYVGTYTSGTRWDPTPRVRAYNSATGAQTGQTWAWAGAWKIRAVSTDPTTTEVYTLHDNGAVLTWPQDLGNYTAYDYVFTPIGGDTLLRMCDMEALPDNQFVATALTERNGVTWGTVQLAHINPANGDWRLSTTTSRVDTGTDLGTSCPRVSLDPFDASHVAVLWPDDHFAGGDEVSSYTVKESTTDPGHFGLSWTGESFTPATTNGDYGFVDIAAGNGGVALAQEHLYTSNTNKASAVIYLDNGAYQDAIGFVSMMALDGASWTHGAADHLWWAGREDETGSTFELGTVTLMQ